MPDKEGTRVWWTEKWGKNS